MVEAQQLENLIASLIQFGPSPDGAVERDIEAAVTCLRAENERLTAALGEAIHYMNRYIESRNQEKIKRETAEAREAKAVEDMRERCRAAVRNAVLRLSPSQRKNGDILDDTISSAIRALPTEARNVIQKSTKGD